MGHPGSLGQPFPRSCSKLLRLPRKADAACNLEVLRTETKMGAFIRRHNVDRYWRLLGRLTTRPTGREHSNCSSKSGKNKEMLAMSSSDNRQRTTILTVLLVPKGARPATRQTTGCRRAPIVPSKSRMI